MNKIPRQSRREFNRIVKEQSRIVATITEADHDTQVAEARAAQREEDARIAEAVALESLSMEYPSDDYRAAKEIARRIRGGKDV